jgi:hypothetical protein
VFTARYALSPYIKQIRFVFKGLIIKPQLHWIIVALQSEFSCCLINAQRVHESSNGLIHFSKFPNIKFHNSSFSSFRSIVGLYVHRDGQSDYSGGAVGMKRRINWGGTYCLGSIRWVIFRQQLLKRYTCIESLSCWTSPILAGVSFYSLSLTDYVSGRRPRQSSKESVFRLLNFNQRGSVRSTIMSSLILSLSTRWRRVAICMFRKHYPQ